MDSLFRRAASPIRRLTAGETVLASTTTCRALRPGSAVRAEDDLLGHGAVADAKKDALGLARPPPPASRRRCPSGAGQFARLRRGMRPQRHLVSRLQQIARHGVSHDAEAEKSEFCHEGIYSVTTSPAVHC